MVANDQYNSWDDVLVEFIYHDYQYNINTHQYQSLYDTISWSWLEVFLVDSLVTSHMYLEYKSTFTLWFYVKIAIENDHL